MSKKMEKIDITEASWGGFDNEDDAQSQETEQSPDQTASSAFDNINFLNRLDSEFDKFFKKATQIHSDNLYHFSTQVQNINVADMAKTISSKANQNLAGGFDEEQQKIEELLNSGNNDILKIFDNLSVHANRKKMYDTYQEIANINAIAYRMLQVYINNILAKNGTTKNFLNVTENEQNSYIAGLSTELKEGIQRFIKTVILFFGLHEKMKNKIVPETLKLGDYFVEVIDLEPIDGLISKNTELLHENFEIVGRGGKKTTQKIGIAVFEDCSRNADKTIKHMDESNIFPLASATPTDDNFNAKMAKILTSKIVDESGFALEENDIDFWSEIMNSDQDGESYNSYSGFNIDDFLSLDFDGLQDIYLRLIPPGNVLKIEKDGNQFGYLVVEEDDHSIDPNNEIDMYQRFLRDDNDGTSSTRAGKGKYRAQEEMLADKLVDAIGNKLAEILSRDKGFFDELPEEFNTSLRIIAYEKLKKKQKLKFRFLQSDRLINFHTSIDKFRPYGTSIYDPIVLPVKMYTIALMSSVISRLSRASVIRKWNIEVGTKRNYSELIEKIKKDLRSKSISYDNLTSIRNISQILTDFRDIAVISQNGQRFVDMELMPMHDRALPMNDMMDLRNELIAATGIPAVYLNIGDSIEMRESLVNVNIGFSHTIANLQGFFEDGLNNLLNAVFDLILKKNGLKSDFKLTQFFKITLNHPLILQLQQNESVISSVTNVIGLLNQSGISFDPLLLFKKYLPDFNWDEIVRSGDESVKRQIKEELMKPQTGGGY